MKLAAFLVLVACLQVSTRVYSQKVSLSYTNVSLAKVFKEITRQTGYSFLYTDEVLSSTHPIDIRIRNVAAQWRKPMPYDRSTNGIRD